MTLLICEDDPFIALDLCEEAERRGARKVVVVGNSVDAMRALEGHEFSAAIVDIHLADGRSGPAIALHLAKRGIRTIVLSGAELDCVELADCAHVFIRKPTPAEIVIDCAHIDRSGAIEAA